MKKIAFILLFFIALGVYAQTDAKPAMLLGKITREDLNQEPYTKWFHPEYSSYEPDKYIASLLHKSLTKDYSFTVFMATWCGDTHRELPRFMRLMDALGVPKERLTIVAVNMGEGVHKQSPTGEEKEKNIFRVPTFIVNKNGKEVGRMVEFPVYSLERDLLTILSGEKYVSNYKSYPTIISWLENNMLTAPNISINGLAEQIRFEAKNAAEIIAAVGVLRAQGKVSESAKLCEIAYKLFPDENYYANYANVFQQNKQKKEAEQMIKKALAEETDEKKISEILKVYDKINKE